MVTGEDSLKNGSVTMTKQRSQIGSEAKCRLSTSLLLGSSCSYPWLFVEENGRYKDDGDDDMKKKSSGVINLSSIGILPLDCAAISHDFIMMSQYVPVQLVTHKHWNWFPSCTQDPPFLHGFFGLHQSTNFSHRSPEKPDEQWHLYEPSRSTQVASFRHGLESQRLSCSWQLVPLYPERQRHWNELMSSMHVPPCRQELETRMLKSKKADRI